MVICDLCKQQLVKGTSKWVEHNEHQICFDCIKLCDVIVKDKKTFSVTYLPLYKEQLNKEKP